LRATKIKKINIGVATNQKGIIFARSNNEKGEVASRRVGIRASRYIGKVTGEFKFN
jgi:hypothetical protein